MFPPHPAFRLTNIIVRDGSTRTPSVIRRHARFHPQNPFMPVPEPYRDTALRSLKLLLTFKIDILRIGIK